MNLYIPEYNYKFPQTLTVGNKNYILTYVRHMLSEYVYDMSTLENNPYTFPEVQTLLDGITIGGHKLSDQNQILNIQKTWDYILSIIFKNEKIVIDKELICNIHHIVAKDEALIAGDFRNGNIGIAGTVKYKCIDSDDLEVVFNENIENILNIENPLEKAIILNIWLSYCQFFYDGNKRTSRFISNIILLSEGIGVLSIPARHKYEYNELMLNFYETLEADDVIEFILTKCITYFDGNKYIKHTDKH